MKNKILLLILMLSMFFGRIRSQPIVSFPSVDEVPLNNSTQDAIILHKDWQMRESVYSGNDGSKISTPGYNASKWYSTTVPTTVLAVLVRHGVYPDPYIGLNNLKIPDASEDFNIKFDLKKYSHLPDNENPWISPYWFRTEFYVPEDYSGKTIILNFDGINYRADIWINGKLVADSKMVAGMFRRFHFDVSDIIKPGKKNALAVCIHQLDIPGNPVRAPLYGLFGKLGACGGDAEILKNVTQYCSVGWDWVPPARDRNIGIWQHVTLQATGKVLVSDTAAFTDVSFPEAKEAKITIRCMVENTADTEQEAGLKVRIEPIGFNGDTIEFKTVCHISPKTIQEIKLTPDKFPALTMQKPRIWWPVNYGEQALYKLTIESEINNKYSNKAVNKFGVRTIETNVLPSGGRAFIVNGKVIRLVGGAWVPDFLMSWSAHRYWDEVRLMAEGNHTIVRINGCGIIAPDVFMEACDKYGLLVWQELSRTSVEREVRKDNANIWDPPYVDPKLYLENMKDCIVRLRSHPSLIIWGGSNEAPPQSDIGCPLQNEILPALDGSRIWLPSSSETPKWSNIETHVWTGGPWDIQPINRYFKLYEQVEDFAFNDEIGLASPPTVNSFVQSIPNYDQPLAEWFPLNLDLSYHDAAGFPIRALDKLIRENLGQPTSINEYLWMGNLYNNIVYRTIFESANKSRPRNAGTMLWKTNAAWPSFNWQVFDWYLRPNAGYYSMRSACKPLHVQASPDDMTIQVANNLKINKLDMKIITTVVSCEGFIVATDDRSISAKADAISLAGSLPTIVNDGKLYFVALELIDSNGQLLDRTVTWMQKKGKWGNLLNLDQAKIIATVKKQGVEQDEIVYTFSIHNTSKVPAVNVVLEILNGNQGREVLPSFWTDNEMTLLPDEKRELTVRFRKTSLHSGTANLMIEGWNVSPSEMTLLTYQLVDFQMLINDLDIKTDKGKVSISFSASQIKPRGVRINNWPIPILIDGKPFRNVLMGLKNGQWSRGKLEVDSLSKGIHTIKIGDEEKIVEIEK
jgi:hypothetical protein